MLNWLKRLFAKTPANDAGTDTEFTAEVVRITEILPHPNADRLEIARFEMKTGPTSYEVVVGKGDFRPGDLAGYFSVDCIVPTSGPEFAFLTSRADGVGKTHYRLKAARLRGVFSQGLLVQVSGRPFGAPLAQAYGVTYHSTETRESNGPTAATARPKPQPAPVYSVDSLKKLPRLFNEGELVLVTEKIHGTNFRFGWVRRKLFGIPMGYRFFVGSHRVVKGFGGAGWYGEDVWTTAAEVMQLARKTKKFPGHVFYGELYGYTYSGRKIQDLTYGCGPSEGPALAVFDVRNGGRWLSYDDRIDVVAAVGLQHVPVLALSPWTGDLGLAEGKSTLDPDTVREGIVVESTDSPRRKAKFVSTGYLMRKDAA